MRERERRKRGRGEREGRRHLGSWRLVRPRGAVHLFLKPVVNWFP